MTTSVTIKNNGPHRINVNECEPIAGTLGKEARNVGSQTLGLGEETTVNVWSANHYLTVLETDEAL